MISSDWVMTDTIRKNYLWKWTFMKNKLKNKLKNKFLTTLYKISFFNSSRKTLHRKTEALKWIKNKKFEPDKN
jgi:hypothetical protein